MALVAGREFFSQSDDGRMQPQLQDCRNAPAGVLLYLSKTVDVPGIEDQRLLADGIGS